jgi:MIT (microtubule interacting and transport) domain
MPQPPYHRRPSRSNSRSNSISSSVATRKRSTSVSSKPTPKPNVSRLRAASPGEIPASNDFLTPRTAIADRRGSFDDNNSVHNRNINRWSHSTTSSISGIDAEAARKRMQDTSRRMSLGPAFSVNGSQAGPSPDGPRGTSCQRPNVQVESGPYPQDLAANQKYPQYGRGLNSSATNLTPTSMFNTHNPDYFGESWHHRKQSSKFGEPVTAVSLQYTPANQKVRRGEDASQLRSFPPQAVSSGYVAMQKSLPDNSNPSTTTELNQSSAQSPERRRSRGHRSPTQKTMLSKALAKANTAVLFDNAQNIEGAIEAYAEACELLQQVMKRSSDRDDRKKLSAIQSTYSSRIAELHDLDDSFAGLMDKALPDDPPADDLNTSFFGLSSDPTAAEVLEQVRIPPRQESLLPQIYGGERYLADSSAPSRRPLRQPDNLTIPMESQYMPPPLSPRRPPSPPATAETIKHSANLAVPRQGSNRQYQRRGSSESLSWLDEADDAVSSHSSSRLSSLRMNETHTATMLDETEAEFDAALNAAVDAAYDDDPNLEDTPRADDKYSNVTNPSRSQPGLPQVTAGRGRADSDDVLGDEYLDDDTTEEEERLLDEMTQGFVFDDFHFDGKSKSALPRQSDSSSFSHRTVSSSVPSTTLTTGTTLSTLAESRESPTPAPTKSLPLPPGPAQAPHGVSKALSPNASPPKSENRFSGINLRDRRLSGQSAGQLKIETFAPTRGTSQPPSNNHGTLPKVDIPAVGERRVPHTAPVLPATSPPSTRTQATQPITPITSVHSADSLVSQSPATSALTQSGSQGSLKDTTGVPSSPLRPNKAMPPPPAPIRKNLSSSSLRMRNLSVTINEETPVTPNSAVSPESKRGIPPLPTPTHPTFTHQTSMSGGMYLFDDHIGVPKSPKTPRTPNAVVPAHAPAALEACPESFLLRPWWLMRCLYQTLAHPRGGYLSMKLFVPRDVWRVRNVKLRLIEEKVAQCDILTAALLQIAKVDHFDAEAVLNELQSFETVLEQVRVILQKKLGNEVGLSSSANVFKSPTDDPGPLSAKPSNSSAAKSFASSWRKLRSKSSSAAIPTTATISSLTDSSAAQASAGLTMSSLPMTAASTVPTTRTNHKNRLPPPTPTSLPNIPINHSTYMASLARLFDAVQILDSIARQVVDPGLKCSSETHVGLELSVRNAAEFFAFYVVRFVMVDLGLLIDKFLKRGSEWVLA